ncbi:hypothetical protein RJ55_07195 [Drechmeria coniospora]|nr:hypothetical protein RJ55_07195 [Drechmeria coniospora]
MRYYQKRCQLLLPSRRRPRCDTKDWKIGLSNHERNMPVGPSPVSITLHVMVSCHATHPASDLEVPVYY